MNRVRDGLAVVACLLACHAAGTALANEAPRLPLSAEQGADRAAFIVEVRKARQGHTQSQWQVGLTYARLGEAARALPMLLAAATSGHPEAATLLGSLYEDGRGTEKNDGEAKRWYQVAVDHGEPVAMAALGRLLLHETRPEPREAARKLLHRAADLGNADGQYQLGWILANRGEPTQDDPQALTWFARSAQQGHVGAQLALASHLLDGRGVQANREAAEEWLDHAAGKGDPVAHYLLARLRLDAGLPADEKSLGRFRFAAVAGHREAQFVLATLLAKSVAAQDRNEAAEWFEKALQAGHKAAANSLGELYRDGTLPQLEKARDMFQLAAEQGNANGMYNLGVMQDRGSGGRRDADMALLWYSRAAEAGHGAAAKLVERLINSSLKSSDLGIKGFWQ